MLCIDSFFNHIWNIDRWSGCCGDRHFDFSKWPLLKTQKCYNFVLHGNMCMTSCVLMDSYMYVSNHTQCPDISPHILYDLLHSWSPIHKSSCKYSYADKSYNNFEFSVVAILKIINGGYHKNQMIRPHILFDLLHSCPPTYKISCKYSHADQSYSNFNFSMAAI